MVLRNVRSLLFIVFMIAGVLSAAPLKAQETSSATQDAPSSTPKSMEEIKPQSHKFWDRENAWLFSGVAVSRALDYSSTRNMLARGREEILIPDDVVNSRAGFPALEAAGAATSVGISYIFHRYGHHKLERWVSTIHIGVTSFGAAHNYALKSKHP
jgi:hypothetical protein